MSKYENDLISKRDLLSALCDKYIYDDRIPVLPSDYLCAQRETLYLKWPAIQSVLRKAGKENE